MSLDTAYLIYLVNFVSIVVKQGKKSTMFTKIRVYPSEIGISLREHYCKVLFQRLLVGSPPCLLRFDKNATTGNVSKCKPLIF